MPNVDAVLTRVMRDLDIQAPLEEFKKGIEAEREHAQGRYKVVPMNLLSLARIAAAHLEEMPDYYSKLEKMEGSSKTSAVTPPSMEQKKKQKSPSLRTPILNLMGLPAVNSLIDSYYKYFPGPQEEEKKQTKPEVIDDDFFTSSEFNSSEEEADDEKAIYPTDVVQKPKQMNTAAKSLLPPGIPQLGRLQEQMRETLHYVINKLLPESKSNPEQFQSLRELRDNLETSLLHIDETLDLLK